MFDATLHKQKMFDQTKKSAIKLKDIPCRKVSSCSFEEPPISFSLTAYYAMRAEIFGCLPFIRTTRVKISCINKASQDLDVLGESLVQCINILKRVENWVAFNHSQYIFKSFQNEWGEPFDCPSGSSVRYGEKASLKRGLVLNFRLHSHERDEKSP